MPPDSPPADSLITAIGCLQAGDLDGAEAVCRVLLEAEPRHADAHHLLGVLEHRRGRHDAAIEAIGRAIELAPDRPHYRNNLGVALKAAGRLEEAAAAYLEALRLEPAYADARSNLGVVLGLQGDPDRAAASFEAALRLAPGHADALFNYANLLRARGDLEGAVGLYGRAHRSAPGRVDVLTNLGATFMEGGHAAEAGAAYRRAAELSPGSAASWANLGVALADEGRAGEAADCFAAAGRLSPGEPHWPIRVAASCPGVFPDAEAIDRYRFGLEAVLDAHRGGVPLAPAAMADSGVNPPFALAHHGRDDRALKAKFAALFRDAFPARRHPVNEGPARVGFVATRGREGIFLRCTGGMIDRLDPGRFRVAVFGWGRGLDRLQPACAAGMRSSSRCRRAPPGRRIGSRRPGATCCTTGRSAATPPATSCRSPARPRCSAPPGGRTPPPASRRSAITWPAPGPSLPGGRPSIPRSWCAWRAR